MKKGNLAVSINPCMRTVTGFKNNVGNLFLLLFHVFNCCHPTMKDNCIAHHAPQRDPYTEKIPALSILDLLSYCAALNPFQSESKINE
jgi:hypothetical protein